MSRKFFVAICGLIIGLSSAGLAAADEGVYVGIRGDVSFLNDSQVSAPQRPGYPSALDVVTKSKTGFAVRGAVGYAFHDTDFRIEGEIGYRRNGLSSMNVNSPGTLVDISAEVVAARAGLPPLASGDDYDYADLPSDLRPLAQNGVPGTVDISGSAEAITLMANGYYDFHLPSGLKPYIGAGLGVAILSANVEGFGRTLTDDSDTVFAYQGIVGVGYEVSMGGMPVTLLLDYSYFGSQNPTLTSKATGTEFEAEFDAHYVGLGALVFF